MMSQWSEVMSKDEIEAHYALTASIDPRFAREERAFYSTRTPNELRALAAQAWNCNEPTSYQMARSYLELANQ